MLRILFLIDTCVQRSFAFWTRIRDRLYWKFSDSRKRTELTTRNYSNGKDFAPGGDYFERGLFSWEEEAISKYFPASGKILVGGCGAGREMVQLGEKGYSVVGFDPSEQFIDSFRQKYSQHSNLKALRGSYEDLILNRLILDLAQPTFDGIILGWSSFSHVTSAAERLELLQNMKRLAPKGPLLVSFYVADSPRDSYWPSIGFVHQFSPSEIEGLFRSSGFQILVLETNTYPQPYAVLTPE